MIYPARISLGQIAELTRRLATALDAGIDVRTVFAREEERASGALRRRLAIVSQAIKRGDSMAEGLDATGDYFPPLFRRLAEVGELTGHQGEVFGHLAEHYQDQLRLRRAFLAAITWPMFQLGISVLIIGSLIWIMGLINKSTGANLDPLGLGLIGERGVAIYFAFVFAVGLAIFFVVQAIRLGLVWTRPIQHAVLRVPVLGGALQTLAIARLAWSLHLTLLAGMNLRPALRLSLQSTRNARYTDRIAQIDADVVRGNSLHEAFQRAGGYPTDFLDTLAVSEESGRMVESMALLSRQYHEQARMALTTLTTLGGYAIWAVIGLFIILLIFRLFMFYVGTLNSALNG